MLAPVSSVTGTAPTAPIGTPVATDDTQLQLQRQLEDYNRQLEEANRQAAIAQQAAQRQAQLLQEQIEATQQQLDRMAANRQEDARTEQAAQDRLQEDRVRADQLQEDRLLETRRAEDIAADRLAADNRAADQLAIDNRNQILNEPQIRPPTIDATDTATAAEQGAGVEENAADNADVIPPLAPDDTGRLVNTLV